MAILTTAINVQINKEDKERATEILKQMGISMSTYINMSIKQLIMQEKIPFEILIPKKDLIK